MTAAALDRAREALKSDDEAAWKRSEEDVMNASKKMAEHLYGQTGQAPSGGPAEPGPGAAGPTPNDDVIDAEYDAPVERAWLIDVAAFDWNCPKHITPRFTEADIAPSVDKLMKRIADLEAQLELAAYTRPQ